MGKRVARKRQATAPEVAEVMWSQGVVAGHGTGDDFTPSLYPESGRNSLRHNSLGDGLSQFPTGWRRLI